MKSSDLAATCLVSGKATQRIAHPLPARHRQAQDKIANGTRPGAVSTCQGVATRESLNLACTRDFDHRTCMKQESPLMTGEALQKRGEDCCDPSRKVGLTAMLRFGEPRE